MELNRLSIVFILFVVMFPLMDSQIGWHVTLVETIFYKTSQVNFLYCNFVCFRVFVHVNARWNASKRLCCFWFCLDVKEDNGLNVKDLCSSEGFDYCVGGVDFVTLVWVFSYANHS